MWSCFRYVIGVLSLMLLLGFGGAVARAEGALDDERARAHFIAGESHFAAGRWSDAVREFTLAYELSQRQEMLINRSRAYERDGRLEEARGDLALLLERHPETRYRAEAETRLERLSRQLAAAPLRDPDPLPEPIAAPATEPASAEATGERAPGARRRAPRWAVVALGSAALVAGTVALGTGLRAHAIHRRLKGACPDATCPLALGEERDHGRTLARVSTGVTFVAVALLGGALGVYVHALRRPAALGADLEASAHGAAARLRVRF